MEEFNVTVHVQVQLVRVSPHTCSWRSTRGSPPLTICRLQIGFSGEGNGGVNVNEQELLRFLDALPPADAAYVAHAEPRGAVRGCLRCAPRADFR
jgi:hypothetical protein